MDSNGGEMKEAGNASEAPLDASNPAKLAETDPAAEARRKKKKKRPRAQTVIDEPERTVGEEQPERTVGEEQEPTVLGVPPKPKKKRKQSAETEPGKSTAEAQGEILEGDPNQSDQDGHKPAKKRKAKSRAKDEAGKDEHEASTDKTASVAASNEPQHAPSHEDGGRLDAKTECLKVCAANLPYWFDKTRIWRHFRRAGDVQHVWLLWDQWSGESKGIAFITFADQQSVKAALEFDGTSVAGYVLRVNLAADKAEESKAEAATGGWAGGGTWGQNPHYRQNQRISPGKGKSKGKTRGAAGVLALADKPEGSLGLMARGLSFSVTEADLKSLFAKCGSGPTRVRVLVDKVTGESKGKAFMDFADEAALKQAVALNDTVLKGRPLRLEFSRAAD